MRLLFNTVLEDGSPASADLLYKMAVRHKALYPSHKVSALLSKDRADELQEADQNITLLNVPASGSFLFRKQLMKRKIAQQVRSFQPDALISAAPLGLNNEIFIAGPGIVYFLKSGEDPGKQLGRVESLVVNCHSTVVFSRREHDFLSTALSTAGDKVHLLYRTCSAGSAPLSFEEKHRVKEKIADGSEYFICAAGPDDQLTVDVLKGFSGFKKWQRSSMKLILLACDDLHKQRMQETIATYRFRDDVSILSMAAADAAQCIAAAYAMMLPDPWDHDFSLVAAAVKSGCPLIIPSESTYWELVGDAGFQFKANDHEDITRVFLETFRDERMRFEKIIAASEISSQIVTDRFDEALCAMLLRAKDHITS